VFVFNVTISLFFLLLYAFENVLFNIPLILMLMDVNETTFLENVLCVYPIRVAS